MNLLLSWDDQKTISAADMEEFLSKFLEAPGVRPKQKDLASSYHAPLQHDAKVKHRINPRLTSEIFLRPGKMTPLSFPSHASEGESCGHSGT